MDPLPVLELPFYAFDKTFRGKPGGPVYRHAAKFARVKGTHRVEPYPVYEEMKHMPEEVWRNYLQSKVALYKHKHAYHKGMLDAMQARMNMDEQTMKERKLMTTKVLKFNPTGTNLNNSTYIKKAVHAEADKYRPIAPFSELELIDTQRKVGNDETNDFLFD